MESAETPEAESPPGFVERHRATMIIASVVVVLASAGWLVYFFRPGPDLRPPMFGWYTTDDGATWFQDDAERVPPFDHNGKPAVRLHLYTCDGGHTTFIGYLQKLPDEVLAKYRAKGVDPQTIDDDDLAGEAGWLVKRPGEKEWVNSESQHPAYIAIVSVKCPGAKGGDAEEVFPKNPPRRVR